MMEKDQAEAPASDGGRLQLVDACEGMLRLAWMPAARNGVIPFCGEDAQERDWLSLERLRWECCCLEAVARLGLGGIGRPRSAVQSPAAARPSAAEDSSPSGDKHRLG